MRILAIETSCDETAIAIADFSGPKWRPTVRVLSNVVSSQVKIHAKFGGVVPNLAKREHQKNLVPVLIQSLKEAGLYSKYPSNEVEKNVLGESPRRARTVTYLEKILERERDLFARIVEYVIPLQMPAVDAIAVTYGPGLAPALWVGVNFAKALAYLWEKPVIPVDHMAGHLYSALLQEPRSPKSQIPNPKQIPNSKPSSRAQVEGFQIPNIKFPALALLVSGGHTELVLVTKSPRKSASSQRESALTYKIVGETLDDAAGEAFDKVARILGLGYPGGPEISRLAEQKLSRLQATAFNLDSLIRLPRPLLNTKDYNFSFSGLKTAVLYLARDLGIKKARHLRPLIAKEFQDAVVDVLVQKTIRAAREYKAKTVLLGGGVAANRLLRLSLSKACRKGLSNVKCLMSNVELTGDNALMIALAAYFAGKKTAPTDIGAEANARLS